MPAPACMIALAQRPQPAGGGDVAFRGVTGWDTYADPVMRFTTHSSTVTGDVIFFALAMISGTTANVTPPGSVTFVAAVPAANLALYYAVATADGAVNYDFDHDAPFIQQGVCMSLDGGSVGDSAAVDWAVGSTWTSPDVDAAAAGALLCTFVFADAITTDGSQTLRLSQSDLFGAELAATMDTAVATGAGAMGTRSGSCTDTWWAISVMVEP